MYFGKAFSVASHVLVSCAGSLDAMHFVEPALNIAFKTINLPWLTAVAAKAIDKIIRKSSTLGWHFEWVKNAVHDLIYSPVEIAQKVLVVESYAYVVARNLDAETIPGSIAKMLEGFSNIDFRTCDSDTALHTLKIVFAIGKTLHTTAPRKLENPAWERNGGRQMQLWVRSTVIKCFERFILEYEFIEVRSRMESQTKKRSSRT